MQSPFWVAGKINMANLSIVTSKGRVGFSFSRASGYSTGIIRILFDADHPDGNANYLISVTNPDTGHITVRESPAPRVTAFHVLVFNTGNSRAHILIHFSVRALPANALHVKHHFSPACPCSVNQSQV